MKEEIRVVITDDHPLIINGYHAYFNKRNVKIVGEAFNGKQTLEIVSKKKPDVLLLDLSMPEYDGFYVLQKLQSMKLPVKTIVVSGYAEPFMIRTAFHSGAKGFLNKTESGLCLSEAIDMVMSGKKYFSPSVEDFIYCNKLSKNDLKEKEYLLDTLSTKETEILEYLIGGVTNKEIEEKLKIKQSTIRTYLGRIKTKLNVDSKVGLVQYAFKYLNK